MQIILASRNPGKVREVQALLPAMVEVVPLSRFPDVPEVEETGDTFEANAALKAETVCRRTGVPALADDSGLVVDALDGEPGVRSARFAGDTATDAENNARLLQRMAGRTDRAARFVCVLAWARPGVPTVFFRGETEGVLLTAPRGENGFGYDPLFFSPDLGKSFAEASEGEKGAISHRGRALQAFAKAFADRGPDPGADAPTT